MTLSEEMVISNEIEKTEKLVFPGQFKEYEKEENYLKLKIFRRIQLSIYKPLITLKLGLFLWYAASVSVITFYSIFFKQRGFTLEELSLMYTISPFLLFIYTASLGVLADKIGQAKSILLFNLLINASASFCFIFMLNIAKSQLQSSSLYCQSKNETRNLVIEATCDTTNEHIFVHSCSMNCSSDLHFKCNDTDYYKCRFLEMEVVNTYLDQFSNGSISRDGCLYDARFLFKRFDLFSFCDQFSNNSCLITCKTGSNYDEWVSKNRTLLVVCYMIIQFVFISTYVNIFRFFDITTVALVKEHNSDFGRERLWCSLGSVFGPVMSGLVVQLSRSIFGVHSYDSSFYLLIVLLFLISLVVFKIDIQGTTPAKQMWKKSFMLIKNIDVLFFAVIVTVLGTVWGFQSFFKSWYLQDLKASPFMIGSIESFRSICGLPFLLKSKAIANRLGYTIIFMCAILGRIFYTFGYSFLNTAWPAFLLELTNIFGFHLFWVGTICYAEKIAPQGLTSTVIVVVGGIHFTIGRVTGSAIGGTIMSQFGAKIAYRVLGGMCTCLLIIYSLYQFCRPKRNGPNKVTVAT